jgi:hypothetical protein
MRLKADEIALELKELEADHAERKPYSAYPYSTSFADRLQLEKTAVTLGLFTAHWAANTTTAKLQKKIAACAKGDDALKKLEDEEDARLAKQEAALEFDKHNFAQPKAKDEADAMKDAGIDHKLSQSMQVRQSTPRKHRKPVPDWVKDDRQVVDWLLVVFPTVTREEWEVFERNGRVTRGRRQ